MAYTDIRHKTIEEMVTDLSLDSYETAMVFAFAECFSDYDALECGPDTIREAYHGKWKSEADYVENFMSETGELDRVPESLRYYIDFESLGRDWFINDLIMSEDGHVFARCW